MLYLIATPIGNLRDISSRAIETLKECDYILCEDTRHSIKLLNHLDIQKKLVSHHQFNEAAREDSVIQDLKNGLTIGLISDAGTPGISDPGSRLVKRCREEEIQVTSIPGACAALSAISCSGLNTDRFQFIGFLPRKESELDRILVEILEYPGTSICYESPKRLPDTLKQIAKLDPVREIAIARELTKKFEEVQKGPVKNFLSIDEFKGEIVLLISQKSSNQNKWENLSPEEHVDLLEKTYQLSKKEAIKLAAELRAVPKREVYNRFNK